MDRATLTKLALSIALPVTVGAISGFFTASSIQDWYIHLTRPGISPPNWVFGPVWTILYILMGVSFYLIWKHPPGRKRDRAIIIYIMQLLFNFLWSFIFFYFHQIGLALIEIVILWILIAVMIIRFARINPLAAYINLPYLLWVAFATILNAGFYLLN